MAMSVKNHLCNILTSDKFRQVIEFKNRLKCGLKFQEVKYDTEIKNILNKCFPHEDTLKSHFDVLLTSDTFKNIVTGWNVAWSARDEKGGGVPDVSACFKIL